MARMDAAGAPSTHAAADGAATSIAVPAYDFATHARVAGAHAHAARKHRDCLELSAALLEKQVRDY